MKTSNTACPEPLKPVRTASVTIGLFNPKTPENMGAVLRAAGCYGADAIFYSGHRYDRARKFSADTKQTGSKIPVTAVDDLFSHIPEGAQVIAVELTEGAIPLMDFQHPEHAYYLFGPEDNSITQDIIERCDKVVYIPTVGCMNLAATVNVVLYDRLYKAGRQVVIDRPIAVNRDNRNRTRC